MNIELYIKSGIVESYVFGLATAEEAAELEQLLPHYPVLGEALSDLEYQLELFAIDHEVPPPPGTKEKIEARLRDLPVVRRGPWGKGSAKKEETSSFLSVEASGTHIRVHKYWRVAFITVFILAKILLAFSIYYFIENRQAQKQVLQLEEQLGKRDQEAR